MDLIESIFFSGTYSIPSLTISLIVTIILLIVRKYAKNSIGTLCLTYLPFISGIILYALYSLIFLNEKCLSKEVIGSGIMCGSLATVFSVIVKDLFLGINSHNLQYLAVKGIVQNYILEDKVDCVVKKIVSIIKTDNENAKEDIIKVISENLKCDVNYQEIQEIAILILTTINSLKADN